MYIKDFARLSKAKYDKLEDLIRRDMPVIAGRMAKDHFQDNFRKGGFVNGGLHPWKPAGRLSSGNLDAASNYGTLLSERNHLFSSIKYIPGDYRVRIANDVRYAPLHNWGGVTNPTVTDRMRRFAWAMFYKSSDRTKKAGTGQKKRRKRGSEAKPENPQAQFWKRLALTRKSKLEVKIPQRQFLGESVELSDSITVRMENEIRKILNS